jgi:hypothetical protein
VSPASLEAIRGRLAEVHQLPQRAVRVTLHQPFALVVVDAQLSGEAQIGAVEPDEPGGGLPRPLQLVDELFRGEVQCRVKVTTYRSPPSVYV